MEGLRKERIATAKKLKTPKVPETAKSKVRDTPKEKVSSKDFFKNIEERLKLKD